MLYGSADGWDTADLIEPTWLQEADILKDHQLVDINGDGYPDLVGQSEYELNLPSSSTSYHFSRNPGASIVFDDPVIELADSPAFNNSSNNSNSSSTVTCMDASSGSMAILSNLGTYTSNGTNTVYHPDGHPTEVMQRSFTSYVGS